MLEGLTPPTYAGHCKVNAIAESLSEADSKILLEAVDNKEWGIKTLRKALNARGISISDSPITNHRQKSCACYRVK